MERSRDALKHEAEEARAHQESESKRDVIRAKLAWYTDSLPPHSLLLVTFLALLFLFSSSSPFSSPLFKGYCAR